MLFTNLLDTCCYSQIQFLCQIKKTSAQIPFMEITIPVNSQDSLVSPINIFS